MLLLIALGLTAVAIRLDSVRRGHYFWQPVPASEVKVAPVVPPPAAATVVEAPAK